MSQAVQPASPLHTEVPALWSPHPPENLEDVLCLPGVFMAPKPWPVQLVWATSIQGGYGPVKAWNCLERQNLQRSGLVVTTSGHCWRQPSRALEGVPS